jgi:hypothetical protein
MRIYEFAVRAFRSQESPGRRYYHENPGWPQLVFGSEYRKVRI